MVVSSLLSTLNWPSLLFLSHLFLPRTPTQTTSVLKFFFPTTLSYNSLTSTPLLSEALLLILAPGPSLLTSFLIPLTLLGDFNAHHPTWDSFIPRNPPGNDLFHWITSSGLEILNDPASPTLLYHSTGSLSSPDILLAPAFLAPHCEWRTLPGLGSDHLPNRECLPPLSSSSPQHSSPQIQLQKRPIGMFTNHIFLSISSLLMLTQSTSTRLPAPFPSS